MEDPQQYMISPIEIMQILVKAAHRICLHVFAYPANSVKETQ
jgi:hypothetical protein